VAVDALHLSHGENSKKRRRKGEDGRERKPGTGKTVIIPRLLANHASTATSGKKKKKREKKRGLLSA